jgi:hypothetical protein
MLGVDIYADVPLFSSVTPVLSRVNLVVRAFGVN